MTKRLENALKEMDKVRLDKKAQRYCNCMVQDICAIHDISLKDAYAGFCRAFDFGFIMGMRYANSKHKKIAPDCGNSRKRNS